MVTVKGLVLAALLTSVICREQSVLWNIKALGTRFQLSGSVVSTARVPRIICAAHCFQTSSCVSFNYQEISQMCELLNTASYMVNDTNLISASTWDYYAVVPPNPPIPSNISCAGVIMRYDQPAYQKYDPSREGYVCTTGAWAVNEYNAGRRECRMVLHYQTDFYGYDAGMIYGPYPKAMELCSQINCLGVFCHTDETMDCWLKSETPLTGNYTTTYKVNGLFWYVVCK